MCDQILCADDGRDSIYNEGKCVFCPQVMMAVNSQTGTVGIVFAKEINTKEGKDHGLFRREDCGIVRNALSGAV